MNSWWLRPVPWASTELITHWEIENCEGQEPSRDVGHKSLGRKEVSGLAGSMQGGWDISAGVTE